MHPQHAASGIGAFTSVAATYEMWFALPLARCRFGRSAGATGFGAVLIDIGDGKRHITAWLAEYGYIEGVSDELQPGQDVTVRSRDADGKRRFRRRYGFTLHDIRRMIRADTPKSP